MSNFRNCIHKKHAANLECNLHGNITHNPRFRSNSSADETYCPCPDFQCYMTEDDNSCVTESYVKRIRAKKLAPASKGMKIAKKIILGPLSK